MTLIASIRSYVAQLLDANGYQTNQPVSLDYDQSYLCLEFQLFPDASWSGWVWITFYEDRCAVEIYGRDDVVFHYADPDFPDNLVAKYSTPFSSLAMLSHRE